MTAPLGSETHSSQCQSQSGSDSGSAVRTIVVNPLGGALRHYSATLAEALRRAGATVSLHEVDEPSKTGTSRARWVIAYVRLLVHARRQLRREGRRGVVLVTWPVLGYLDLLILRLTLGRRASGRVVLHDPKPLVGAVGYAPRLRAAIGRLADRHRWIVHSRAAHDELDRGVFAEATEIVPHPLLERQRHDWPAAAGRPVVRVLGQFKGDRDLGLLASIAELAGDRLTLEIHGRGWPEVAGWRVESGFVSESEFDSLMSTSAAVLIPYRRFYQSGIANRCVELGVPFVGPRESSLAELVSRGSPLLVPSEAGGGRTAAPDWLRAVDAACATEVDELRPQARLLVGRNHRAWADWLSRQVAA